MARGMAKIYLGTLSGMPFDHTAVAKLRLKAKQWEQNKIAENLAEADARGILDAKINAAGFVKCPHCGTKFKTSSTCSWDGERHVSCKTRLNIVSQ